MRVLMYGWEFPPKNKGGLGVACHGLVSALIDHDVNVHLVLPFDPLTESSDPEADGLAKNNLNFVQPKTGSKALANIEYIASGLEPYQTLQAYAQKHGSKLASDAANYGAGYGDNLFAEVERYGKEAGAVAKDVGHDVIHAHDWMTYPAAIEAKKYSGKPLIVHIHATELDRTGHNPQQLIYEIEKLGFAHADKIIAVSEFTRQKLIEHYGIAANKIVVVHNAIAKDFTDLQSERLQQEKFTVLFLGRMTMQKGPEYFLEAAQKVLQREPHVNFVMAGDGDMMGYVIEQAIALGIEQHIIFTGFLKGDDVDRAFQQANLFVMPSISEPFGLVALEAIRNGTPVLMSKQSGVSEVVKNALKVDFWDTDHMANLILNCLYHPELVETLREYAQYDYDQLHWHQQTKKIAGIYTKLV